MNQGNKPNYGAEEIRKYHSGELTAGQRHALEKAALEDPFLADALEGYAFTSTPEADLESIRKRLSPQSRKRVIPMFMRAAVLILAVSGMLFLILREDKKPETSVSTLPAAPVPQTVPAPQTVPLPENGDAIQETVTDAQEKPGLFSTTDNERRVGNTQDSEVATKERKEEVSNTINDNSRDFAIQNRATAPPRMDSTRPIMNAESDAIMGTTAKSKQVTRGDTIHVDIVLPEDKAALNEVVVTSLGGKPRAYAPPDSKFETLEPKQGWTYYNEYIAENLNDSEGEVRKKRTARGEVELQFDTNSLGEPENIKVTESECKSCEKQAIRLLKDGPKWQGGMKERKIRIRF